MNLSAFTQTDFLSALRSFFRDLNVPVNYIADEPDSPRNMLTSTYHDNEAFRQMKEVYFVGMVDDAAFASRESTEVGEITSDYEGILIFGVTLKRGHGTLLPTRGQLAEITRAFNREFHYIPVVVVFKYDGYITFANAERVKYKQSWREGEKAGKVTMLKDIDIARPHAAHLKILAALNIEDQRVNSFAKLYLYWQTRFSVQTLNNQFYADLQDWFYYAIQNVKIPICPDYISEKENIKNFLVRLMSRTMFCWFVKEKGLIKRELLELTDWQGIKYKLTRDTDEENFLQNNSYYRGILQNIFFNALNKKEKKSIKDFKWTKYLHPSFQLGWLTQIPYLNGGIFDRLDEDNARETIEDSVIHIPNCLFYGIETEDTVTKGRGVKAVRTLQKVEHKGLNGILNAYKFTLDENTPFEEDIALDPEMLGLVFENLLAELDPNLEESTVKSIRRLTGSYYTPRKIIYEMVNDSLFLYLSKFIKNNYPQITSVKKTVSDLVYFNIVNKDDSLFCLAVVKGLDQFRMLDPACGSGAFPMGMLHRMVDILKLVDAGNQLWLDIKLKGVDMGQRAEFKKVLTLHLNDYSRKLGIIRDSIYGIDIQPMAVQITKLRFFISLLIDQQTQKGITPMPNIETKIICADSLKNIEPDLFSFDAIEKLEIDRTRYYQPDISHEERENVADEIVSILDQAFPSFSYQITGKRVSGQNKALIREWFKHSTVAAPFFNMDFFFPEIKDAGGFDCVMGNPPYGGLKISDEVRKALDIESKDPYGAFIARFLNKGDKITPLKHGGVLAFIVSDTFMTIKSHLKLRKHLMQNYVHKMLRMHPDTFRATVNTVIMIAERNVFPKGENKHSMKTFNDSHICLMADMTNISIHDNYERFTEVLNQTKGVDYDKQTLNCNISSEEYAIYYYPQSLIRTNSNLPFFVASPKLFVLMNDGNDPACKPLSERQTIVGKQVNVRKIMINGKEVPVVKLGDIAEVNQGISTGQNESYVRKISASGGYLKVNPELILSEKEIKSLNEIEKGEGIDIQKHGGKCFIPFDKGSDSNSNDGWMPNYYVENDFFIDWSKKSVNRMRTLTIAERKLEQGFHNQINKDDEKKIAAALRNQDKWFKPTLNFSPTGQYSPTFRLGLGTISQNTSSTIIINEEYQFPGLGILCSRFAKFSFKNMHNHTVHTQEGDVMEFSTFFIYRFFNEIGMIVKKIIQKQKSDPRYDYASHEQIEIDRLVYEAYGLNAEDVQEVENWYARRYPKLSAAQKANLRAIGKSDDYLKLYGME